MRGVMTDPTERKSREIHSGPPCPHYPHRYKTEAAHRAKLDSRMRSYERFKDSEPRQFESDTYPLEIRLRRLLATIKQRCRIVDRYSSRGIQCLIAFEDLLFAWNRDGAEFMTRPSIDRKDNDGHYEPSNIRFIELADNIKHGVKVREELRAAQSVRP